MTAYNRERYIGEAIESVLNSTFRDFELIVVDDCSSDGTVSLARRYESDHRVRVHVNERNLGDYPNRNRAATLAIGQYLKYVDSDDYIYPYGLEVMVHTMSRFPDAGLGLCRPQETTGPHSYQLSPEQAYREHFLQAGFLANAPLSTIIRTGAFWSTGGFSGLRQVGDGELWLKIAARYPVVKILQQLTWWRTHGQQEVMYDTLATKRLLSYQVSMAALNSASCPLDAAARTEAIHRQRYWYARSVFSTAIREGSLRPVTKQLRASGMSLTEAAVLTLQKFTMRR